MILPFCFILVIIFAFPEWLQWLKWAILWILDAQGIPANVAWAVATAIVQAIWDSIRAGW